MEYVKCCECGKYMPKAGLGQSTKYYVLKVTLYDNFPLPERKECYCPRCFEKNILPARKA